MKELVISEPALVAQSVSEPLIGGGYQDPLIHCGADGILYVKFSGRFDDYDAYGHEEKNPLFRSADGGLSWEKDADADDWVRSMPFLPNGDRLLLREHTSVKSFPPLPALPPERKGHLSCCVVRDVFTVEELTPLLGDAVAKEFYADRIPAGSETVVREICKVRWKNMPVHHSPGYLVRVWPNNEYRADENGVLWMPIQGAYVREDGSCPTKYCCTHLLRSDDFGRSWDYVSTVPYFPEYGKPGATAVEGFLEAALELLPGGRMMMLLRSGSLLPVAGTGGKDRPAPDLFCVFSDDGGKTWGRPFPFYAYGVRPCSVRLSCGAVVMASGRPGVYVRVTDDPKGERWGEVVQVFPVPEEDFYDRYFAYSCANNGICAGGDRTAFLAYSDFTRTDGNGVRAKSVLVRRITVK